MERNYGRPLFGVAVVTVGVIVVIAAVNQLIASRWLWAILLVVGLIAVAVGLVIIFSREHEPEVQLPLGSFLVKTKHAELSVPDCYRTGTSVWPQKWWRPWKPEIIHTEQVKLESGNLDVVEVGTLLAKGKESFTKFMIDPEGGGEERNWIIRGWRVDVRRALAVRPEALAEFDSTLPATWIKDPSDMELFSAQIDTLRRIVQRVIYPEPS
jgi:hypothetical protein